MAWRARLAREHNNVRAALGWLLGCGKGALALRLAGALTRFWAEREHLSEGQHWLREALAASTGSDEPVASVRGKALIGAATLAIEQAAYDEAADLCAQVVGLARGRDVGPELVAALNTRGSLARTRGYYAEAARDYEEAHVLAATLGDRVGAVAALHGLATTVGFTGDTARSIALTEQCVVAFREMGDLRSLATRSKASTKARSG